MSGSSEDNNSNAKFIEEKLKITTIAQMPSDEKTGAKLLISEAPGKKYKGTHRSLTLDLETMKEQNVKVIVCLLEWSELDKLKLNNYPSRAQGKGFIFYHFPISVGKSSKFKENYAIASCIIGHLSKGDNVLVHCREGLCRSAVICACCLTHYKYTSELAIRAIRERRNGAIRNTSHINCIHNYYGNIKKRCQTI